MTGLLRDRTIKPIMTAIANVHWVRTGSASGNTLKCPDQRILLIKMS
jgi:hypothetical protein